MDHILSSNKMNLRAMCRGNKLLSANDRIAA